MSGAATGEAFAGSREHFETLAGWLDGDAAAGLTHGKLEARLDVRGRALLQQLCQDHLDLRTHRERRIAEVVDDDGVSRGAVEAGHRRPLGTVFGQVDVERMAYRVKGHANLYPTDAGLNLPAGKRSHGLRRLAAIEASRGSFDQTVDAIERATGQPLGQRQVECLAATTAVDFESSYRDRQPPTSDPDDVLVLSCDGKGIVMRPDALRPATAKAAKDSSTKLATRLSKGEAQPQTYGRSRGGLRHHPGRPQPRPHHGPQRRRGRPAAGVVTDIFDEADRRDPDHARP